jgi:hypothetical protein
MQSYATVILFDWLTKLEPRLCETRKIMGLDTDLFPQPFSIRIRAVPPAA